MFSQKNNNQILPKGLLEHSLKGPSIVRQVNKMYDKQLYEKGITGKFIKKMFL